MAGPTSETHGTHPPPPQKETSDRGHPLPRRTTPEKSITLRHHQLARDASSRRNPGGRADPTSSVSPRRNSSGESHVTHHSDAKKWFDRSNANANATFDPSSMDVDPPFFQKESDSSNEESHGPPRTSMLPYPPHEELQAATFRPTITHSSSADDFRGVIDDLTVENKRLKEELKRYKQFGSDLLKKEKLFEIKVHGLPAKKKRELEAKLRDFAASLGEESTATSSQRRQTSKHSHRLPGSSISNSKHASSSSSHSRPVDSAYASGSAGTGSGVGNSSSSSLTRPGTGRARSSEQKVQSYLEDIPEGLYPRHVLMTEKDKKKWVVQRLEQLFTGKIRPDFPNAEHMSPMPAVEPRVGATGKLFVPPSLPGARMEGTAEASREARMQPQDSNNKNNRSRENLAMSNSNGDQTESGGNGSGSGSRSGGGSGSGGRSGNNVSPPSADLPEQRPTRPLDLDPDRALTATENVDYIRHLGVIAPEYLSDRKFAPRDVGMDAGGWVYLNLLSNMAQLHIMNVTPDFIRSAVTERSTKFQLSPDKRKIRWRGGTVGTKFSLDSSGSGDNSQKSPSEDTEGSNEDGARKRQKTTATSSKTQSKTGGQATGSSESVHYKPLFIHQNSSAEMSNEESDSQASYGGVEESNLGADSRWNMSGSGSSRKRRRNDGAIIYYSGAHFCTDLSGDAGDISPTTYMTSTGQGKEPTRLEPDKPVFPRTLSGSSLAFRPLSDGPSAMPDDMQIDLEKEPELITDETGPSDDDLEAEFPWCDDAATTQFKDVAPCLVPCGIGGVLPEDHLVVVCMTRRSCHAQKAKSHLSRQKSEDPTESIIGRLASMKASSPVPVSHTHEVPPVVEIEYLSGRWKRLKPLPLPPPTTFFPPFSSSSDDSDDGLPFYSEAIDEEDDEDMADPSELIEAMSQQANPHLSDNTYPENELTSCDEEDEISPGLEIDGILPPASRGSRHKRHPKLSKASLSTGHRAKSASLLHAGSSAATAGGEESGYSSSQEELEDD